jgi:hypothetical protein
VQNALINEGAELCIISIRVVQVFGLLIIKGYEIVITTSNGRSNIVSIVRDLRINVFGIVVSVTYLVSNEPRVLSLILGRL